MRLTAADAIYAAASSCTATREAVEHDGVRTFVRVAKQLLRSAAPYPDDELATRMVRTVKRARWNLHSIPLPLNSPLLGLTDLAGALERDGHRAGVFYGEDLGAAGTDSAEILRLLAELPDNPMGVRIADILRTGNPRRSAVLVRRPEFAAAIESFLAVAGVRVSVVSQEQLRDMRLLETLVVAGPTRWYQRHVTSAPRAEQLCFVHYGWIQDEHAAGGLLEGSRSSKVDREIRVAVPGRRDEPDAVDANDLVPEIDWSSFTRHVAAETDDDRVTEPVRANGFLLATDYFVYLPADDGPAVDVIDLHSDRRQAVHRKQARSVTAGDYLLLRSSFGGEDYLQTVANTRLGPDATHLRSMQAEWKAALRKRLAFQGYAAVAQALRRQGTQVVNLAYWVLPDTIRTQHWSDFTILMKYIGLGNRADEIWAAMERINDAHIWAGFQIRKLLEAQVLHSDLSELRRSGRLDFELDGVDAGTLTIFRVEGRSPEPVMVPPSWLRWPRRVDAGL